MSHHFQRVGIGRVGCALLPRRIQFRRQMTGRNSNPRTLRILGNFNPSLRSLSSFASFAGLFRDDQKSEKQAPYSQSLWPTEKSIPTWRVPVGMAYIAFGLFIVSRGRGFGYWL